jgi:hypothetical protein
MVPLITHSGKLLLFTVLSLADLILTWYLLQHGDGDVYEANPVADWWLSAWGWPGLVSFKVLMVSVVGGVVAAISLRHPVLAGKVLTFACTAVAGVLFYSCTLVRQVRADDYVRQATAKAQELEQKLQVCRDYQALRKRLGWDLIHGRRTLAAAVAELAGTERGQDPGLLRVFRRRNPAWSDLALLADNLIPDVVELVQDRPDLAKEVARRLRTEFQASFGWETTALANSEEKPTLSSASGSERYGTKRFPSSRRKTFRIAQGHRPRHRRNIRWGGG